MECLDASVVVKWFKTNEEHTKEAYELYERGIDRTEYVVSEWLILEFARGLLKAEAPKESVSESCRVLETLFSSGIIKLLTVSEVLSLAKDLEIELNLHAADAVHLATAIKAGCSAFWTEDDHLHKRKVVEYANGFGLKIKKLGL